MWHTEILNPVQQATQTIGEVGYANFLPHINGVYNQPDLSGGMGVKYQRDRTSPLFDHYYFTEWLDASIPGQIQKGPAVKTLTAPANSGPMSGYFELGGVPYLCLGRIIAKWNSGSDTLSQVRDLGGGFINSGGAIYNQDGTEASTETSVATGAADALKTSDARIAQLVRSNQAGIQFIGRVDLQLQRLGLGTPQAPTVTINGTAGGTTYSYKVSATVVGGETIASTATTITTGNATLNGTNFNTIGVIPVANATGYNIYRTAGGPTQGKIASTGSLGTVNDTGLPADGSTAPVADTSAVVNGDVRLTICPDFNGRPNVPQVLASATLLGSSLPTSAGLVSFRFDDDEQYAMVPNEPFWLVLDVAAATAASYVQWTRSTTDNYTRGIGSVSADRGNSWTNNVSSTDYYFTIYSKTATDTAFVGADDSTNKFATTTDGSTYTQDTYRSSTLLCTVGDRIVRDIRATGTRGCIQYSLDGVNWSEALPVGDVNSQITNLLALQKTLLVCKTDSIWAVDIVDATITGFNAQQLYYTNPTTTNGQGACVHKGTAYVPVNGRLVAIVGDFVNGFTVHTTVGPEAIDDWDAPFGPGRIVACASSRFHVYALMSATGGYRLLKSDDPINPVQAGKASKKWHGSIATIGDGTQTVTEMHVFDPGGTGNPRLFMTTTANNIAEVLLARMENPASDPNYLYDIANTGKLRYARAHGNFHVNPKAWISESVTFQKQTTGDYADLLYDTQDGDGLRRLGRVYTTDILAYPAGIGSLLVDRELDVVNSAQSASPIILTSALTYAVRPAKGAPLRQIEFTLDLEDMQSTGDLGDLLVLNADDSDAFLQAAAVGFTRAIVGPDGTLYGACLIRNDDNSLSEIKADGGNKRLAKMTAVQVG